MDAGTTGVGHFLGSRGDRTVEIRSGFLFEVKWVLDQIVFSERALDLEERELAELVTFFIYLR